MHNEIIIDGKVYAIAVTMGGLMRFAKHKGIKIDNINAINFADFSVDDYALMLYCLLKSSNKGFEYSLEQIEEAMFSDDRLISSLIDLFVGTGEKK